MLPHACVKCDSRGGSLGIRGETAPKPDESSVTLFQTGSDGTRVNKVRELLPMTQGR